MLYSLKSESYMADVPHRNNYDIWQSRLSDAEFNAVYDELNARVEGSKIETSSWIPGSVWDGTVFQPILEVACINDADAAGRFFGLILWQVLLDHKHVWAFDRYEKDGVPIRGMTYFRLDNPPPP